MLIRNGVHSLLPACVVLAALVAAGCRPSSEPAETGTALDELVASERAFARESVASGMRSAFLDVLAERSTIFRPLPTDGRAWFEQSSEVPGTLSWAPEFADVSADGDLGYTTGPWTYRVDSSEAYGHYVSLWRRGADGQWRLELDTGIGHLEPGATPTSVAHPEAVSGREAPPARPADPEALRRDLLEMDRTWGRGGGDGGSEERAAATFDDDVRVYREGEAPLVGDEAREVLTRSGQEPVIREPSGAGVAASGDLGYTYGLLRAAADTSVVEAVYVRIWKHQNEGSWAPALDLENPVPPDRVE